MKVIESFLDLFRDEGKEVSVRERCFVFFADVGKWIRRHVSFFVEYVDGTVIVTLKYDDVVLFRHTFVLNRDGQAQNLPEIKFPI